MALEKVHEEELISETYALKHVKYDLNEAKFTATIFESFIKNNTEESIGWSTTNSEKKIRKLDVESINIDSWSFEKTDNLDYYLKDIYWEINYTKDGKNETIVLVENEFELVDNFFETEVDWFKLRISTLKIEFDDKIITLGDDGIESYNFDINDKEEIGNLKDKNTVLEESVKRFKNYLIWIVGWTLVVWGIYVTSNYFPEKIDNVRELISNTYKWLLWGNKEKWWEGSKNTSTKESKNEVYKETVWKNWTALKTIRNLLDNIWYQIDQFDDIEKSFTKKDILIEKVSAEDIFYLKKYNNKYYLFIKKWKNKPIWINVTYYIVPQKTNKK